MPELPLIYQLRVTLKDSRPAIWRRVAVPADLTLGQLHDVLQIVMGWQDCHLHRFILRDQTLRPSRDEFAQWAREDRWDDIRMSRIHGERVFIARRTPDGFELDMDGEGEDRHTLAELCPQVKSKLLYEYDFGDGWEHIVQVQKIESAKPGQTYPQCLSGKRACPPEDCGGIWGYANMLEILGDPDHEDHEHIREWIGGDWDAEHLDLDSINHQLTEWAKPARPAKRRRKKQ